MLTWNRPRYGELALSSLVSDVPVTVITYGTAKGMEAWAFLDQAVDGGVRGHIAVSLDDSEAQSMGAVGIHTAAAVACRSRVTRSVCAKPSE
jgi:hypothetical protein